MNARAVNADHRRRGAGVATENTVRVAPLTGERWPDLVELFERKGPRGGWPMPANCYCMWWRQRTGDGAKNKQAMRRLVRGGAEPGLLAYLNEAPVGWVSIAPRASYGQLARSRTYRPQDETAGVWAIVCFYVDPRAKGHGVARALLAQAVKYAFTRGAQAIEAYPLDRPDYMGNADALGSLGFEPLRTVGKRTVMRLKRSAPKRR